MPVVQLSESKMRKMSTPESAASSTNFCDHVVGIVGIADGIGTAQQHLKQDIGDQFGQFVQSLPRIFTQKAHRDVKGGPAPALQRKQVGAEVGGRFGNLEQVIAAHAGCQVRLVGVAHGGIGNQQFFLFQNPFGEPLGPQLHEQVLAAGWARPVGIDVRSTGFDQICRSERLGHTGRAVDDDLTQEAEHLAGTVLLFPEMEQFRMFFDKRGIALPAEKDRMGNDIFKKTDIGLDPADAELLQGTVHDIGCIRKSESPGADLDQQRIIMRGDLGAGKGVAGIETDAATRRRSGRWSGCRNRGRNYWPGLRW